MGVNPDGTFKGSFPIPANIQRSSPAFGPDGTVYLGATNGIIYAINSVGGALKWSYATGGSVESSPAVGADGTVYFGADNGNLYAVRNSAFLWSIPHGSNECSPAIGPNGTIYAGDASAGYFNAINPDGSIKWSYLTGGQIWSSPAVGASGVIYVGSGDGNLHAVNPADGSQRWTYPIGSGAFASYPSPVIGPDGVVYVSSWDQNLYAIYTDCGGPAASSWPMFRRDPRRTGRIPLTLTGVLMVILGG